MSRLRKSFTTVREGPPQTSDRCRKLMSAVVLALMTVMSVLVFSLGSGYGGMDVTSGLSALTNTTVPHGAKISLNHYATATITGTSNTLNMMETTYNGKHGYAFCINPGVAAPPAGQHTVWNFSDSTIQGGPFGANAVRAALYYGYNGPGYERDIFPTNDVDGSVMDDNDRYVYTHMIATYLIYGPDNTNPCRWQWGLPYNVSEWVWNNIINPFNPNTTCAKMVNRGDNISPSFDVFIVHPNGGGSATQNYIAWVDGGYGYAQMTKEPAVPSPGYSLEGALYTIHTSTGGDTNLVFETDASGHGILKRWDLTGHPAVDDNRIPAGDYKVHEFKVSDNRFDLDTTVYDLHVVNGQTASFVSKEPRPTTTTIEDAAIKLVKRTTNSKASDGNAGYSYAGAKYDVYKRSTGAKVGELTTKANGESNTLSGLEPDTWYDIVEMMASPGYYVWNSRDLAVKTEANKVICVNIVGTAPPNVPIDKDTVPETPIRIVPDVLVRKKNSQGQPVAGAKIRMSYWNRVFASIDDIQGEPTRVWNFITDSNGEVTFGVEDRDPADGNPTDQEENEKHAFFVNAANNPFVPLGTILIEETKAPEGYGLPDDPVIKFATIVPSERSYRASRDDTDPAHISIAPVDNVSLKTAQSNLTEPEAKGGVCLKKVNPSEEGIEGAKFVVTNKTGKTITVGGQTYANNADIDPSHPLVSDENGYAYSDDHWLPLGSYSIRETEAPSGYELGSPAWSGTFTLTKDGQVYDFSNEPVVNQPTVVPGSTSANIKASKMMENRDLQPSEFSFQLLDSTGTVIQTKKNAANGNISFSAITYGDADSGKTFTYKIKEVAGSDPNVTYDSHEETVTVKVTGSGSSLTTTVTYAHNPAKFINTYNPPEEPGSASASIEATKMLDASGTGRTLEADEFSFQLLDSTGTVIQTKKNAANGKVTFSDIPYQDSDSGKTFTYKIKEVAGADPNVTYDSHEETVTVKVTGSGTSLTATVSYDSDGAKFTNKVTPPEIETTLKTKDGEKTVSSLIGQTEVTLVDTVKYSGLTPGQEYELHATLHQKDLSGSDIGVVDGATGSKTFTPEASSGTVDVEITVDLSKVTSDSIVAFEKLLIGTEEVATHEDITDDDQTVGVNTPEISTSLTTTDGKKETSTLVGKSEVTLVDTVTYKGLTPGKEYELHATMHQKDLAGGDAGVVVGAEGSAKFTPDKPDGSVEVLVKVDLSKVDSTSIVAFEKLLLDTKEVANHEDITDEDQAVTVRKPEIATTLATKDGKKSVASASGKQELIDTVEYKGLVPGQTYEMSGVLHLKKNGADGGELKSSAGKVKFTPTASDGKVQVILPCDTTLLTTPVVAFEECRLVPSTGDNGTSGESQLVAEHKDINDVAQTVTVAQRGNVESDLQQTGDGTALALVTGVIMAATGVAYARSQKKEA